MATTTPVNQALLDKLRSMGLNVGSSDPAPAPAPAPTPASNAWYSAVNDWQSSTSNPVPVSQRATNTSRPVQQTAPAPSGYYPQPQTYYQQPRYTQPTYTQPTYNAPVQGPAPYVPPPPPRSTYKVDPLEAAVNQWQQSNQKATSYDPLSSAKPDTGYKSPSYDPLSSALPASHGYQPPRKDLLTSSKMDTLKQTVQEDKQPLLTPAQTATLRDRVAYPTSGQEVTYGYEPPDTGPAQIQQSPNRSESLDPGINVPWALAPNLLTPADQREPGQPSAPATTVTSPIGPQYGNPGATQPQPKPSQPWDTRLAELDNAWNAQGWQKEPRNAAYNAGLAVNNWIDEGTYNLNEPTPAELYLKTMQDYREEYGTSNKYDLDKPSWDRTGDVLKGIAHQIFTAPAIEVATAQIPGSRYLANYLTQEEGADISLGQLGAAMGQGINQAFNKLNPNFVQAENYGLYNQALVAAQVLRASLTTARESREIVEGMGNEARAGLAIINSGGDRVLTAAQNLVNQDDSVANFYRQAEQYQAQAEAAYAQGLVEEGNQLAVAAAQAGRAAYELKNKSQSQIIEEQMNPWAEIVGGILLDPANAFDLGPAIRGMKNAKIARAMDIPDAVAVRILGTVDEVAEALPTWGDWLYKPLANGESFYDNLIGPDVQAWFNAINPLVRTGDTQAHAAVDVLYRGGVQLLGPVTSKATAKQILTTWATNPRQLVEGMQTAEGVYKIGGGALANPYIMEHLPALKKIGKEIADLPSLEGTGAINPRDVLSDLKEALYGGIRNQMGLAALPDLPAGTIRTNLVKTATGQAALEYLGKKGEVIGRGVEMTISEAANVQKAIRESLRVGGGENKFLRLWGVQKSFLSDMFLGLKPGYTVKNALSATVHLTADDTMTLLPTTTIIDDLGRWYGGAPTTRALAAETDTLGPMGKEALGGGQHWSEYYFGDQPYAKLLNWAYSFPYGGKSVAGGRIPVGEQNFALRGTYVPIKRYITENWDNASRAFGDALEAAGIAPDFARTLQGVARDAGINGNKQQVAAEVKKAVTSGTVRQSLSELGVPDELLSAKSWAELQDVFNSYLPDQIPEAADAVRRVFASEFGQAGEILNAAPPQPTRAIFTGAESLQDNAAFVDATVDAAKRAGIDSDTVKQASQAIADKIAEAETTLWAKIRGEVASSDDPKALNVALDLLGKWYDWRENARRGVDELGRVAIRDNTPQAWNAKWQGAQEIYGSFPVWFEGVTQEARHGLLTGQAEGYDWFKAIERYASYDDYAVQAERAAGSTLGPAQDELYPTVIGANREFIDKTFVDLFSAFKRYPSEDSLDILADGIKKVEQMGAQTAQYVAEQRAKRAAAKISKTTFYSLRNRAWAQFFDNGAIYNKVQQRILVSMGVAENVTSNLRWVDEFAGGEFQLVGRAQDGLWEARRLDDGTLHHFAGPDVSSPTPNVPKNIIDDFNRAIGNVETTTDEVLQAINRGITNADEFDRSVPPVPDSSIYAPSAQQIATVQSNLQKNLERVAGRIGVSVDELIEQGNRTIQGLLRSDIAVQVDASVVDNILDSGFRSQFSTGTTSPGKSASLEARRLAEQKGIGIPQDIPDELRPIYGFLLTGERAHWSVSNNLLNTGYGDITFILNNEVRPRSTALVGDSLGVYDSNRAVGLPLDGEVSPLMWGHESTATWELAQSNNLNEFTDSVGYIEAQIQGGVRLQDVRTVLDKNNKLTPQQIHRLESAGVEVLRGDRVGTALETSLRSDVEGLNHLGLPEGENLYEFLKDTNATAQRLMGDKAPEMGQVAEHTINTLAKAEEKILLALEELLTGKPGNLTPAQQLLVMDTLEGPLSQWDNILAAAAKVGDDAANFAMLNYNDRRNMDTVLGFMFPWHFYQSRTPKNWAQRVLQKPAIVSRYNRFAKGVVVENKQTNQPLHLQGTVANPAKLAFPESDIVPDRLQNPMNWFNPFPMLTGGNEYVDVDDARSQTERWFMQLEKYAPGMTPVMQFGMAAYLDATAPLPKGRTRVGEFQLGDYIPLYQLAKYARQSATGEMGPEGFLSGGDEYDYGRAGRQVELLEEGGAIKQGQGAWGVDVGQQRQKGLEPLPEQPPGMEAVWETGAQRAGLERLISRGMSYLLGVPGYFYSDEERKMRERKAARVGLGYDPIENPFGTKAAVSTFTEDEGGYVGFNYAAAYPGNEDRTRPGVAAATNDYWNDANLVFDEMGRASTEFLTENPNASTKELNEVKGPFWDDIKAINEAFPSVPNKVGERETFNVPRNTKYMSPNERAEYEVKNMLGYKPPGQPEYPGEDAKPEEFQAYYKDKAAWDMKRLNQVDRNLNQLIGGEDSFPDAWQALAKDLIEGKYSSELMRVSSLRNAGFIEKDWSERQTFVEEVTDAEYRNKAKNVKDRVGEDGVKLYNDYLALPKDDDSRPDFKKKNPEVNLAFFAAFNAQEYDEFIEKFGEDALAPVFLDKKPSHPGDAASETALQSYYGELDSYNKKYPEAEEVRLWVNGRRFGPDAPNDDYGRAHKEAIDIFGEDIFKIVNSFPSGGTKAEIGAWYRNNAATADMRSAYFAWRREHNETDAASSGDFEQGVPPSNEGAGRGYVGPRPVGMDFVPVGENRWWEEQGPNRWATTDWEAVAEGPASNPFVSAGVNDMGPVENPWALIAQASEDNPWTKRGNELNAALFGDVPIPSEMAGLVDEDGNPLVDDYVPSDKDAAEYVSDGKGGYTRRSYSRKGYTPWENRGYSSGGRGYSSGRRGYSSGRRGYSSGGGGGSAGGSYYVNPVTARGLSNELQVSPRYTGYEAPRSTQRLPDIGPDSIRAWRPLSW